MGDGTRGKGEGDGDVRYTVAGRGGRATVRRGKGEGDGDDTLHHHGERGVGDGEVRQGKARQREMATAGLAPSLGDEGGRWWTREWETRGEEMATVRCTVAGRGGWAMVALRTDVPLCGPKKQP